MPECTAVVGVGVVVGVEYPYQLVPGLIRRDFGMATRGARRTEWRKIIPKSSMRVPIPGIVAAN